MPQIVSRLGWSFHLAVLAVIAGCASPPAAERAGEPACRVAATTVGKPAAKADRLDQIAAVAALSRYNAGRGGVVGDAIGDALRDCNRQ